MGVTATVKVFIDVFIGIWAFLLAWIWSAKIEPRTGDRVRASEIWERFPKFVFGYMATFLAVFWPSVFWRPSLIAKTKTAMGEANVLRSIFFVMTFFTIGVVSNFRKLWEEGIGRLALVTFCACSVSSSGSDWRFPGSSSTASIRRSHNGLGELKWINRKLPMNSTRWSMSRCCPSRRS